MTQLPDNALVAAAQRDDDRPTMKLLGEYRSGADVLRAAVTGMTPEQLLARPIEGKFSSMEVVCHLADTEQFIADRMKRTIGLDRPLLVGLDPTPYLVALRYQERDMALQLDLVALTRRQMAEDLDRLPADAWTRRAVHTETGLVTLRQQLLHAIRHLQRHVAAIAEKRTALDLPASG
jgi:uncharacterized damage-inducible protein DinB